MKEVGAQRHVKKAVAEQRQQGIDVFGIIDQSEVVQKGLKDMIEIANSFTSKVKKIKQGKGLSFVLPK